MSGIRARMKATAVFLLKLALTALCLWWAFSKVEIDHPLLSRPGALHPGWLAAGLGFAGLTVVLQALRWWCFLKGQGLEVRPSRTIELTMIDGLFSLASVSGIGGSAARVILLMREQPGRKLVIAMAVTADHLAGLVSIAILFFVMSAARFDALADPSVLGRGVIEFAWFYLGGGLAMVALIFVFASPPLHRRIHAGGRFDRWPMMKRIPELYDVYRRNWRHALGGLGFSFVMLFSFFTSYFCGLRAVGGTASYADVMSAMPVIDAVSGMPVSIAGVGVREKLFQVLLHDLAGVPAGTAVAASLAGFACNTFWALCGAFFFLRKQDRIRRSDVEEAGTP